jgi:hypothetical protein
MNSTLKDPARPRIARGCAGGLLCLLSAACFFGAASVCDSPAGELSVAFIVAVFLANFPEAMSASAIM